MSKHAENSSVGHAALNETAISCYPYTGLWNHNRKGGRKIGRSRGVDACRKAVFAGQVSACSCVHNLTVVTVTGTRLSHDQARQNLTMDGGSRSWSPILVRRFWYLMAAGRMMVCFLWGNWCSSRWSNTHVHSGSTKWILWVWGQGTVYENRSNSLYICMKLSKNRSNQIWK